MNLEQCALSLLEENFKRAMEKAMAENDTTFLPSSSSSPLPPLLEPELGQRASKSPEKSKSPSVRRRGKARIYNEVSRCYSEEEVEMHSRGWRKLRTRNLSRKGQVREFECPLSRRHTKCRMGMRIETHLNEADGKLIHIVYHTSDTAHNHMEDIPPVSAIDSIKPDFSVGPPNLTPNFSNLAAIQERARSAEQHRPTPCLSEDSMMSVDNPVISQIGSFGLNAALFAMDEQKNWITDYIKRRWHDMSQENRTTILNTILCDVTQSNLLNTQPTPVTLAQPTPQLNLSLLSQLNAQVLMANKNIFFNLNQ
ncbi:unnamed protein product [Bursaphelenchus okinawaensis]|uniref:Uncharacterized protein n=1 Tax=Bursaphelenchus okinawaensis TaxID=465554 RepID=A0A811KS56_9BILA|nr:unnamed protein product [Bursaphelenchus okinawaensis]CAG9111123.1 unnamed protein product [Bursaphelenchus okinawaensis]